VASDVGTLIAHSNDRHGRFRRGTGVATNVGTQTAHSNYRNRRFRRGTGAANARVPVPC
jgi:hypothetical protein